MTHLLRVIWLAHRGLPTDEKRQQPSSIPDSGGGGGDGGDGGDGGGTAPSG